MTEVLVIDLFGDPVVARSEGPGRPEHRWSLENSNKVLLAFARGLSVKQAATAIGLSAPTLRKVYFSECQKRTDALLRLEMTHLAWLTEQAQGGNVSAAKELMKQVDRLRSRDQQKRLAPEPTKAVRLGKKEQAQANANDVRGLYEPPAPPRLN